MLERHIEVPRTARYYVLGTPGPHITDVWVVCHGFAQLASRFLRRFEPVASDSRLIVAPEALNRFYLDTSPRPHGSDAVVGATWMTREDREAEIVDYVRYLDRVIEEVLGECGAYEGSLLVLGFSQGAATASRWFSLGRVRAQRLVLWSGHIPSDLPIQTSADRWRAADVRVIWGDRDAEKNAPGIERDRALLATLNDRVVWSQFSGGHELNAEVLQELAAAG